MLTKTASMHHETRNLVEEPFRQRGHGISVNYLERSANRSLVLLVELFVLNFERCKADQPWQRKSCEKGRATHRQTRGCDRV